jgi:hypothetical protein
MCRATYYITQKNNNLQTAGDRVLFEGVMFPFGDYVVCGKH